MGDSIFDLADKFGYNSKFANDWVKKDFYKPSILLNSIEWLNEKSSKKGQELYAEDISNSQFGEKVKLRINLGGSYNDVTAGEILVGVLDTVSDKIIKEKSLVFEIKNFENTIETPLFTIPQEWFEEYTQYFENKEKRTKINLLDRIKLSAEINFSERYDNVSKTKLVQTPNIDDFVVKDHKINIPKSQYKELRIPIAGESASSIISNLYWSEDKSLTKYSETKILKYGQKSSFITLKLNKSAKGKKVTIKVYADDIWAKTRVYEVRTTSLTQKFEINIGIKEYQVSDDDDVVSFTAIVSIPKVVWMKIDSEKGLKVHAVIFIPEIMKKKGWNHAFKCQEEWFYSKSIYYPWDGEPRIHFFNWELAIKHKSFETLYNQNKGIWKNNKAIIELKKMINEMIANGEVYTPGFSNQVISFECINNKKIVLETSKPEELDGETVTYKVPLFEKYYFTGYEYEIDDPLDDVYASIANCNVHFACNFSLSKNQEGKIEVEITEVAAFIRDGFDFVGETQKLGYWSFKDMDVSNSAINLYPSYRLITNKSYNDYNKSAKRGGSYYQYSTSGTIQKTSYKFIL